MTFIWFLCLSCGGRERFGILSEAEVSERTKRNLPVGFPVCSRCGSYDIVAM